MHSWSKISSTLALAVVSLGLSACAQNQSIYSCNPAIEGFWRNIGCGKHWDERNRIREKKLSELQAKYDLLSQRRSSLEEIKSARLDLVNYLNRELENSRQTLIYLQSIRLQVSTANASVNQLKQEMAFVASVLDSALQIEVGCETRAYRNARAQAELQRTIVKETVNFGIGELRDRAATEIIVSFTPGRFKTIVRQGLKALSTASTVISAALAADEIGTAYQSSREPILRTQCL